MIQNSLEWHAVQTRLLKISSRLSNRRDINRMITNVQKTVTDLSRAEVDLRMGRKHRAIELLAKVNAEIEMIEEFITVAALIG